MENCCHPIVHRSKPAPPPKEPQLNDESAPPESNTGAPKTTPATDGAGKSVLNGVSSAGEAKHTEEEMDVD